MLFVFGMRTVLILQGIDIVVFECVRPCASASRLGGGGMKQRLGRGLAITVRPSLLRIDVGWSIELRV